MTRAMTPLLRRRTLWMAVSALVLASGALAGADKPPAVALESIRVDPGATRPDLLHHLFVTVRNTGGLPVSALEFTVTVGGRSLRAYKERVFLDAVDPGAAREIRLLNFWSSEAGRPAPANPMKVEVSLLRAVWMQRESKDGATVWTPAGPVEGLPSAKTVMLAAEKAARPLP
jgi:hypothetical protein